MSDDDAAWLAAALDAYEQPSAELVALLFGNHNDDHHDDAVPRSAPSSTRRKRSAWFSTPRAELQRLRLEAATLANVHALLVQRHETARRLAAEEPSPPMASAARPRVWGAVADRQLQALAAAKRENQRLRDAVAEQLRLAHQLVQLLRRAQRALEPPPPVPRPMVPSATTALYMQRRMALCDMVSAMHSAVDEIVAAAALEAMTDEVCTFSLSDELLQAKRIPCGAVLGTAIAGRTVPCTPTATSDHLWQSRMAAPALVTQEYDELTDETHMTHYTVSIQWRKSPTRLLGVSVRVRLREATRDVVLAMSSLWPDECTPSPVRAVAYTTREWQVIQPHATLSGWSSVLTKMEQSRLVHADSPVLLTSEEASVLRLAVDQSNKVRLGNKNRRLDELLLR